MRPTRAVEQWNSRTARSSFYCSTVSCSTFSRGARGFTLLELMVVLIIIMVMVTAVVPNLDMLSPKYSLRAGAREIAATIESIRSQSVLIGKTFSIVYDLEEQQYWILMPQELDEYGEPTDNEREIAGRKRDLPAGVEIVEVVSADNDSHKGAEVQFDFSPFGNTGSHVVVVQYGEEEDMRIWVRINALLGFTTFHYEEVGFVEYEAEEDDEFYGQEEEPPQGQ